MIGSKMNYLPSSELHDTTLTNHKVASLKIITKQYDTDQRMDLK